jgi:hypothetical protein
MRAPSAFGCLLLTACTSEFVYVPAHDAGSDGAPASLDAGADAGRPCAPDGTISVMLSGEGSNGPLCPPTVDVTVHWSSVSNRGDLEAQFVSLTGALGVRATVACSAAQAACHVALACDSGYSLGWTESASLEPQRITLTSNGPCRYFKM